MDGLGFLLWLCIAIAIGYGLSFVMEAGTSGDRADGPPEDVQ